MGRKRHELAAKYEKGEIRANPLLNCPNFCRRTGFGTPLGKLYMDVLGDNREVFKKAWGPMDFAFKGEYYYHCWVREFEGEKFIVLTANEKGTAIEMVCPDDLDYSGTTKYMDDRIDLIERFVKEVSKATR